MILRLECQKEFKRYVFDTRDIVRFEFGIFEDSLIPMAELEDAREARKKLSICDHWFHITIRLRQMGGNPQVLHHFIKDYYEAEEFAQYLEDIMEASANDTDAD